MTDSRSKLSLESKTDVMLVLLGAAPRPIVGITRLVKMLFLAQREAGVDKWLGRGEQYYGYRPYKMGPFSADVYDDIELLEEVNLISGKSSRTALSEEIEEWRSAFADDLAPEPEPSSVEQEVNRTFTLTAEGKQCADALLASLTVEKRRALDALRERYDRLNLRDLLVYVYTRYPEMTQASEIKGRLGL